MDKYVLGFIICEDEDFVLLMRKKRPNWQRGKFNGVGGKIEDDEGPTGAMIREGREEIGIEPTWRYAGQVYETDIFQLNIFETRMPLGEMTSIRAQEDEPVEIFPIKQLPEITTIENISWIVNLLVDSHLHRFRVKYRSPE